MGRDDRGDQPRWQGRQQGQGRQQDDIPDFGENLGPGRSPLEEMRDHSFFGDSDDAIEELPPDEPEPTPARARASRPRRAMSEELPLTGTALLAVIAYFAIGGVALIITGLVLGGFAGILLALVGLLSAAAAGLAAWQQFAGR